MSEYIEILEELKMDLQKDDIVSNNEQISFYDLYNIINFKFESLRSITTNDRLFTNKQFFHRKKYIPKEMCIENNLLSIDIYDSDWNYSFKVCCEMNSNDIFFDGNKNISKYIIDFIKKYSDELNNVFSILKNYSEELDLIYQINKQAKIKYSYYTFYLECSEDGVVDLKVNVSDDEKEIQEIYKRNYYNKEELGKVLEKIKFDLSKKILIDVKNLKEPIRKLVYQYFNSSKKPSYSYSKIKK